MFDNTTILWLIEDVDTRLWYYISKRVFELKIQEITDEDYWTNDAWKALGFNTEKEALDLIKYLKEQKMFANKNMITTDHMFLS